MTDSDNESGVSREDLLRRVELMEQMIAEGRQSTARFGWIFVLWGLVDLAGMALEWEHPGKVWNWPIAITAGLVLQFVGLRMRRRTGRECGANTQSRAVSAIWMTMGTMLILYCFTAIFTRQAGGAAYLAAVLMTVGLAHGASAIILRWPLQGAVALLWWAGGLSCFFVSGGWFLAIFGVEMLFGMVLFGLYGIYLERRTPPRAVAHHA